MGYPALFCTFLEPFIKDLTFKTFKASMKNWLHFILMVFCLVSVAGISVAVGQDSMTHDFEITSTDRDRYDRDKIIFSGGENETRYMSHKIMAGGNSAKPVDPKDSAAAKTPVHLPVKIKHEAPAKQTIPAKQQPPKEDDDAILSFNFLYYIIQKYKLQEIIE